MEVWRTCRPWMTCVLLLAACQARGLVGSNETAISDSDPSDSTAGSGRDSSPNSGGASAGRDTDGAGDGENGDGADGGGESSSSDGGRVRLDIPRDGGTSCEPPKYASCDGGPIDELAWHHALGWCDDEATAEFVQTTRPGAMMVVEGRIGGDASPYVPREGERMLILSTGNASELLLTTDQLRARYPVECADPTYCPSSDLGGSRRGALPAPLKWRPVHGSRDCTEMPGLIGTGDCSNSLHAPWQSGDGAYDYSELRMAAKVPENTDAIEFDFAFFSSEYPAYTDGDEATQYNDMFVAWLESEAWTGNVSFDDNLQPITAQSVFMDFRAPSESCPECNAPELQGFAMERHGGTKWLTTKAPVVPEETIELVFAIFDLSDASMDSMVLLDGFEWSCSISPPITKEG